MDNYRFYLEKYHRGSKKACPECRRKACFTRYIDESGEIDFLPQVANATTNIVAATITRQRISFENILMNRNNSGGSGNRKP